MGKQTRMPPVIAIDGPSGSGKGTIAQRVAMALGWHFLDSGALYRLVALSARNHGMPLTQEDSLGVLARNMDVQFIATDSGDPRIVLEGEDVSRAIRTDEMGRGASTVAILPAVREGLLQRQRDFRDWPGLVADGRDMGTVVFTDAPLKIYLTASAAERADRRFRQLQAKGLAANIDDLLKSIQARDDQDMNRPIAPLRPAEGAVMIDSTGVPIEEVLASVMDAVQRVGLTGG